MNNRLVLISICIVCMIAVCFSGCLGSNPEKPVTPGSNQTLPDVQAGTGAEKAVVDANNRFALKLYSSLCDDPLYTNTTVFFSPFSISSALAVTYEGARGDTADEIRTVFFFPNNSSERRAGFERLYTDSNQDSSRYILKTANALWAEKTYQFLPDYIHVTQTYYHANATNLDFKNQPEASRTTINRWVEDQTDTKIMDLIQVGGIDPLTRLVITNAVYFKGIWVEPFDRNQTKDDIFTAATGIAVPVRMMEMAGSDAIFKYTETDSLQVLEMPYAADNEKQLSMLVLLPKAGTLSSVEKSLDVQNLSKLRDALIRQRVKVAFPRFTLETRYSLPAPLSSMGMPAAFSDRADFSGMDGTRNLYIGDVVHQAFIDVNEEGTEAAAATAVVEKAMASAHEPPVPVFRADHPFTFLIQDNENGNILFMGRVNNPNR
jgi:serpin B